LYCTSTRKLTPEPFNAASTVNASNATDALIMKRLRGKHWLGEDSTSITEVGVTCDVPGA